MPDDAANDAQTNSPSPPQGATEDRAGGRTTFWLSSIGWETVLLIVGVAGTLFLKFLFAVALIRFVARVIRRAIARRRSQLQS